MLDEVHTDKIFIEFFIFLDFKEETVYNPGEYKLGFFLQKHNFFLSSVKFFFQEQFVFLSPSSFFFKNTIFSCHLTSLSSKTQFFPVTFKFYFQKHNFPLSPSIFINTVLSYTINVSS